MKRPEYIFILRLSRGSFVFYQQLSDEEKVEADRIKSKTHRVSATDSIRGVRTIYNKATATGRVTSCISGRIMKLSVLFGGMTGCGFWGGGLACAFVVRLPD